MGIRILVVDDEREIADLIELYLTHEGYTVRKFYSGREALACVEEETVDLAVLDVMLPDIDGFSLLQTIRKDRFFPIIMLTAKVEDVDKITGLMLGADDYITKPFNPLEVVARVKTQLRRTLKYDQGGGNKEEIDIRGLIINKSAHKCTLYGRDVELTPLEFEILWYLSVNRGRVVSSERLFEDVWGEKYLNNNNTVMAHIKRIREKIGDSPKHSRFIKTVWGVGYQIE